jgi:hypothetical protein
MVNIGYIHGDACICNCCNLPCTATNVGNITVTSCSSCLPSLCQSTYSSACGGSVNVLVASSCVSGNSATTTTNSSSGGSSYVNNGASYYSAASSSDAHTFFKSIYRTLSMTIISFPILIYQKIK